MVKSLTELPGFSGLAEELAVASEPALAGCPPLLLAKSKAIRMAKYLHRCSTRALEVVLMYLVQLSFMALTVSLCSSFFNISGCSLNTISISCVAEPEAPESSALSSLIEELSEVGGLIFFFLFLGGGRGESS